MAQMSQKVRSAGFVIENNIIKGDTEYLNVKEENIGELIFNTLSETPECIGDVDALTGKSRSFAEIKERSVRLAAWMRKEGIGPGDVVSVCTPSHSDVIIIFYATTFVGATFFPFSSQMDLESSRRQINALHPELIFVHKDVIGVVEEAAMLENHKMKVVVFDDYCNYKSLDDIFKTTFSVGIRNFQVSKVSSEHICIVLPTSGTTGTPKLIPIDYKAIMHTLISFISMVRKNSKKMVLFCNSVETKGHYLFPIACLLNKWTQVFQKDFDAHETFKIIDKYKINIIFIAVTKIVHLINTDPIVRNKYDLSSVIFILSLGSRLFEEVRKRTHAIFPNLDHIGRGFGMSEAGFVTSFTKQCRNAESEGTVMPNVQVKIIDTTTGLALGQNQIGELCIKSPCMIKGYYQNPAANKLAFDDEGWFHSGDKAYYDENGEIVAVGRLTEIIKYRDTAIYPSYIEQKLFSHPNIMDAAVVGIDHDLCNEQPVVYVKVTEGSNVTEEDVLKLMPKNECNNTFKNWIIFTDEIPRSENGKILRRILKEHAENYYKSHRKNR